MPNVGRLKTHYKKIFLSEKNGRPYEQRHVNCKYFVAVDFEATCMEENGAAFPHEIIEFPAVLVEVETGKTIAKFHRCYWTHRIERDPLVFM